MPPSSAIEAAALAQRREDDRVFRTALREQRVPLLRSWIMWAWVSADREREFGGVAGVLLLVQVVVGALLVLGASVAAFWQPWWLLLVLAPALAALPWAFAGLAPLVLLLTYSSAVLAPLSRCTSPRSCRSGSSRRSSRCCRVANPGDVVRPTVLPPGRAERPRLTLQITVVSDAAGGCCPAACHPWKCFAHHVAHAPSGCEVGAAGGELALVVVARDRDAEPHPLARGQHGRAPVERLLLGDDPRAPGENRGSTMTNAATIARSDRARSRATRRRAAVPTSRGWRTTRPRPRRSRRARAGSR